MATLQDSKGETESQSSQIFFPRPEYVTIPPRPFRRGDPVPEGLQSAIQVSSGIEYFENRPMTGPELFKLHERFGDRVFFYSGQTLSVALFSWFDVRQVLSANSADFIKGPFESVIGAGVGWGLLTQEGQSHTIDRHKYNAGFRSNAMAYMGQQVEDLFDGQLSTFLSADGFEAMPALRTLTHKITLQGILGVQDFAVKAGFEDDLYWLARFMTQGSFPTNAVSEMGIESFIRARVRFLAYVDQITERIVQGNNIGEPSFGKLLGDDHSGPIVRGEGTHAQVAQFLSAGTETTASLISSMLFIHSQSADAWDSLKRATEVSDSTELDARLDEALRLFPPAAISTRVPIKDVALEGLVLPAGIQVFISPYVTQRKSEYFEHPLDYDWQRWASPEARRGLGYFPFGFGPRMCIGYNAARHTAKSVLKLFTSTVRPSRFLVMPDFLEQYIVLGPDRKEKLHFSKIG
jgi:cytochrome P450